jgi:predicted DNA-binding transcriptional regulator YafY
MPETYQIPEEFDVNKYLAGAWGIFHSGEPVEVRLRFYPPAAARVKESIWHPSQALSDGPKGSVNMTVTVTGTVEITPWILGWGDAVEILAPQDLRKKIADTGAKMEARNKGLVRGSHCRQGRGISRVGRVGEGGNGGGHKNRGGKS